ncbi:hypothetical protein BCCR75502_01729 [Burkholderia sola]|nr:hypothetical protein BCCR75389_01714 [Burkholderia cenocepacia]CAG2273309.1 hypothetical protein BCCR75386_01731 [Burkholderia cenocepacia]CAG2273454.1 hypothetical protein BCCR75388_01733 [Burkholderia cenocepacia]CAG2273702.1 hypothetical protein BCCR75384_01731 [Burkholderia cenocepacia]CAG2273740.1 hypothetical protein BCCR75387_01731 [Burkholderia cenocepacia]
MESLPIDALDRIALQLALLNVLLCVYLVCKGVGYASAVIGRRDPPKKLNRSKLAQSDGS